MAVKSKKKVESNGSFIEVDIYLPPNQVLTKEARIAADKIDEIMCLEIKKINSDFQQVDEVIKKNAFLKWKWLSVRLNKLLQDLKEYGLTNKDIEDNIIWIPLRQYLCEELLRDKDKKRIGTHKDHYRKVYLLSKLEGLDWIHSWTGWNQFAQGGDDILQYPAIFLELDKVFNNIAKDLKSKDYRFIAKRLVRYIPLSKTKRKSVADISQEELTSIAQSIFEDYKKMKEEAS